ncbi:MAG: PIN domain-containing protein [Candidatus Diapherotrites archaeon]|nr:PIN domain-containing protein [Candidatus Diapherotrites archaeon]
MQYFADTFALIEYLKDNPDYLSYFERHTIITTKLNLMELYYSTLREADEALAEKYYAAFLPQTIDMDDNAFKNAARMRAQNPKLNLSYVDCIGYSISLKQKIKFLTGDKAFAEMKNVEWVKRKA